MRALFVLLSLLFCASLQARAQSCSVSAAPMSFPSYNAFSGGTSETSAVITTTCTGLLFLGVSFVPFLFVAPLIGPAIDRMAGGRRLVIQIITVCRIVISVAMAFYVDSVLLFPLAFAAMVLKRSSGLGVGLWRTTFVVNIIAAALFSLLWLLGGPEVERELLWQPGVIALCLFVGQIAQFLALERAGEPAALLGHRKTIESPVERWSDEWEE